MLCSVSKVMGVPALVEKIPSGWRNGKDIGAVGLGYNSQSGPSRHNVAGSTPLQCFLGSCVAQTLSCGNGRITHYTLRRNIASLVGIGFV